MQMKSALLTLCLALLPLSVGAATQTEKGLSTVPVTSSWSSNPSASDKASALAKAKVNAVERYIAQTDAAEQKDYDLVRSKVAAQIDDYVLSSSIVSEDANKDSKTYTVVISADINVSRLDNELRANSAVSNTSQNSRSYITFVFMARQQDSVQAFDARVVKHTESNNAENGTDTEAKGDGQKQYASETNQSKTTMAGGSSTRHADIVQYAVTSSDAVNDIVSNALSGAGYQVVDAAFLEQQTNGALSIDAFKNDFSKGNDISPHTLQSATTGAQQAQVPYLAYGTLDVGLSDTDPTTGLSRVYVTVTAKVYDLTRRFPVTVASVGPVQYAGTGANQDVARTNALKQAADAASKELVSEMDAKGIH
jgi:hypothetical protein